MFIALSLSHNISQITTGKKKAKNKIENKFDLI
jgi:hypothetical protein